MLQLSKAGLNLRVEDVNGTLREFEERMQSLQLSDEQIKICRQVRQKGKNRESARRYKLKRINKKKDLEKKYVAAVNYHNRLMKLEADIIMEEYALSHELNDEIDRYLKIKGFDPKEYAIVKQKDDNGQDKLVIAPLGPNGEEPCQSIRQSMKPWWRCENCQE